MGNIHFLDRLKMPGLNVQSSKTLLQSLRVKPRLDVNTKWNRKEIWAICTETINVHVSLELLQDIGQLQNSLT